MELGFPAGPVFKMRQFFFFLFLAVVRAQPKKEKKGRKEDEQRGVAGGKRSRENGAYGIR